MEFCSKFAAKLRIQVTMKEKHLIQYFQNISLNFLHLLVLFDDLIHGFKNFFQAKEYFVLLQQMNGNKYIKQRVILYIYYFYS